MLAAYDRIREIAWTEFPQIAGTPEQVARGEAWATLRLTGKHYLFMNMMERFTDTLVSSLALALLAITLVIGLVFRSVRIALVSIVPNVLPLVIPLALLGLLGISLDGPAVIVATIALGVCVDDTIHLITKFRAALAAGMSAEEATADAFRQVGAALTWTSLTLVVGFAVLTLSDFRPNMLTGALGAAMVALAWVADLLVAPALLQLVFGKARSTSPSSVDERAPQLAR
jgi:predicted RND superfamily exporter protein